MRSRVKPFAATLPALALVACAAGEGADIGPASRSIVTGPAADYPVVIGEPYTIDGIDYEPVDRLNYDAVGLASVDEADAAGVTAAHKTLPLPSYVEITSLKSGRTILARVERRGPMVTNRLIELSNGAAQQLAIGAGDPVRVRRVLPPEIDRAELRADRTAPLRMDTPQGLLAVLQARLPVSASPLSGGHAPEAVSDTPLDPEDLGPNNPDEGADFPSQTSNPVSPEIEPMPESLVQPAETGLVGEPYPVSGVGAYFVQLGTFSVKANAESLAEMVDGFLVESGNFTVVRTGPYSTRGQADAALAKLRGQGYTDALIRNSD